MTGAILNAGDYLIDKRVKELILHFIPDVEITELNQVKQDYSDKLDFINSFDALFFRGGPIYCHGLYPNELPFVRDLNKLTLPIFFVGGGVGSSLFNGMMDKADKSFYNLGLKSGVPLGCRDIMTYRILKKNGYNNIMVTGCPAWYNLSFHSGNYKTKRCDTIRKICVSEPAREENVDALFNLLYHLRDKYPHSEIELINHREKKNSIFSRENELREKLGVSIIDIAGSADGFALYDNCDLHVGFRVHAHIYNLSNCNISVLFNEDIRGIGMNYTLGLESINTTDLIWSHRHVVSKFYLSKKKQEFKDAICKKFDDYMETSEILNFENYSETFRRMEFFYERMSLHFEMINKVI